MNISQNLHAQTSIAKTEIQPLLIQLRSPSGIAAFQLTVQAELWWQMPAKPTSGGKPFISTHIRTTPLFKASMAKVVTHQTLGKRKLSIQNLRPHTELLKGPQAIPPKPTPSNNEVKFTDPQKIDLKALITRAYTRDDELVFGPLAEEFGTKDKAWKIVTIPKAGENYTIAYQPTSQLDVFNFLPQVFRIKAKEQNGDPRISISMIAGEDDQLENYKIIMAITLVPYYNALAKKDLYRELNKITKGLTKYCELRLGGYKSVRFELRSVYSGENAVLTGKIPETIAEIDPVNGFVLNVECKFDSFDNFRREIGENEGIIIGDIAFELLSAEEGDVTKIHKVPVELNISKLAGVNLAINADVATQDEIHVIKGVNVNNTNNFDVLLKGIDLTLLSQIEGSVYDAEYDPVLEATWPASLQKGSAMPVVIKPETDENDEPELWTDIVCEPYGISILNDPGKVLERLIDFATGDPQVWRLEISCPLFERWNDLDDPIKSPYTQVSHVITEIKNEKGQTFSVKLKIDSSISVLEMSRSISEILKSQQLKERKYQYRVGTIYIINPPHWTDWLIPESTATDFLSVNPQPLSNP
ncbi:hypothetical protein LZ575_01240 [Antarcticibacterium sp. 1MA-6-2]|uniref:hypothetical protein n=1 Tax=Antarcticibacterium sp. 1MA-6-2 TaxID=2908210 RepID=UPI001F3436AD|nr:hypothetical protein [Antarcticibacterium sp. 1MA-6-2]UJH91440.1 hypothetical protein LZ575_01240 [Antarcticibacterium sp. 1MA-6-2]